MAKRLGSCRFEPLRASPPEAVGLWRLASVEPRWTPRLAPDGLRSLTRISQTNEDDAEREFGARAATRPRASLRPPQGGPCCLLATGARPAHVIGRPCLHCAAGASPGRRDSFHETNLSHQPRTRRPSAPPERGVLRTGMQRKERPHRRAFDAERDLSGQAGSADVPAVPQGEDAAGCESHRQDEAAQWHDDVSV
jgi:hypothetical protein